MDEAATHGIRGRAARARADTVAILQGTEHALGRAAELFEATGRTEQAEQARAMAEQTRQRIRQLARLAAEPTKLG
jgi:hypothetical protein